MNVQTINYASSSPPRGLCYRVLVWEACALEPGALEVWRAARGDLLLRMSAAGTKGSRGKLAVLEEELRRLSEQAVEAPLAASAQAHLSLARVEKLADVLRASSQVLAFRLTPCCAEIFVQLSGEEGVDALLQRWETAAPEVEWCSTPVVESLPACEASVRQRELAVLAEETEEGLEESATGDFRHVSVLAREAMDSLLPEVGKVFIDATLGGGGHSELMLRAGAEVWGIDQDPAARCAARRRLAVYGERLHVLAGNFRCAAELLRQAGAPAADGLLADIGVSSPQVDQAARGFSFLAEGPLDMRMDPASPRSAANIVNGASEEELADILWRYGEERASRAIARRIVQEREKAPIETTTRLAALIASVLPRKGKHHPATRSFQALRIAVNDELGALEDLLQSGLTLLKSGGRFAVITFHSLEDRAVKRFFDEVTRPEIDRPEWPAPRPNPAYAARLITRKPIVAGAEELAANPRARSAKLRVIEKI